jgi:hypothetical protein
MAGTMNLVHDATKIGDALARAPMEVSEEIDKALGRGAIELSRVAKQNAPKYRTELTNSIGYERIGLLLHMVRARGKSYGPYVEDGTAGGGVVPIGEMLNWVTKKGITPRTPGMTLRGLAWLIRRSIAHHGIKPNPFFQRSLEQMVPRLDELLNQAADKGLARVAAP